MKVTLLAGLALTLSLAAFGEPTQKTQAPPPAQPQLTQTNAQREAKPQETSAPTVATPAAKTKAPAEPRFRDFYDGRHQPGYPNS